MTPAGATASPSQLGGASEEAVVAAADDADARAAATEELQLSRLRLEVIELERQLAGEDEEHPSSTAPNWRRRRVAASDEGGHPCAHVVLELDVRLALAP